MPGQVRRWRAATVAVGVVLALAAQACGSTTDSTAAPARAHDQRSQPVTSEQAPAVTVGSVVHVAVSVATLWVSPDSPRYVDRPALSRPVHIRAWLRAMSTDVRRDLVGRVETQALYGDRLLVTGVRGHWLHVVATAQPTHRDGRGYPGWLPERQVTTHRPTVTPDVATVVRLTAPLRHLDGSGGFTVSFGTRLPVLRKTGNGVVVATPTGLHRRIADSAVIVADRDAAPRPATRAAVLDTAYDFLGVPYLWGGRSGFAVDCSGFTGLVYGVHGVRLPRDADDQARAGSAVAAGDRHRADLAFFAPGGNGVTHVAMLIGGGRLIQAPSTGQTVSVAPTSSVSGLVAVRRFL